MYFKKILLFSLVFLLCSCSAQSDNETLYNDTLPNTALGDNIETEPIKTTKNIVLSESDPAVYETEKGLKYEIDVPSFDLEYSQEQLVEYINKYGIPDKWTEEFDKLDILRSRYSSAYSVGNYTIIQHFDVAVDDDGYGFVGMHQPPAYYIIFNDDIFTFFYPVNQCSDPWFYISDDILYVYENAFSSLVYTALTLYDIKTGETIEQLDVTYDWSGINYYNEHGGDKNDLVTWTSTINEISDMYELQEYMHSISDTWYN